ncbi:glutathione hydrolase 6-like [Protopterus annectens]|uniref:glutathione hydrolase 6-like n=1 Tax=Protopterus annectens TaxID=7888 RepID=UPI001CFB1C43|nr:glutathione hydrolase 6-like [Protopterus annectens]
MEVGANVRYQRLQQVEEEDQVDGECSDQEEKEELNVEAEEIEDDRVIVNIYAPSAKIVNSQRKKETCSRILAAVILLIVAFLFGLYQFMYVNLQLPHEDDCFSPQNKGMSYGVTENHFEGKDSNCTNEDYHHHEDEAEKMGEHLHSEEDDSVAPHKHEHGIYHHFTVVTDSATCSEVGKDILASGGNAMDAGIATTLCLGLVHPHSAGIGAVFSALYYDGPSGTSKVFNAIPINSSSSDFGIPVSLQTLRLMHKFHGSLEWSTLFSSAIHIARHGFSIDHILAQALRDNEAVIKNSRLCDLFCNLNGSIKDEGSTVTNRKLADLLENIRNNIDNDGISSTLIQFLNPDIPVPAQQTFVDSMKHHQANWTDPLKVEFDDVVLYGASFPAAGNISSGIIEELQSQNLTLESISEDQHSASIYSHILNASIQIYNNIIRKSKEKLLSEISSTTHPKSAINKSLVNLNMAPSSSYIAVADNNGSIFVLSGSLNSTFGSKLFLPSSGIILSDFTEGTKADLQYWASPMVLDMKEQDDLIGIVATGGTSVPFGVAQSIINKVYFGKSLKEAVSGPLFHLNFGDDGTFHTYVSGLSSRSNIFKELLKVEPNLEILRDDDDQNLIIAIVEFHNGHVSSFGNSTSHMFSDGN